MGLQSFCAAFDLTLKSDMDLVQLNALENMLLSYMPSLKYSMNGNRYVASIKSPTQLHLQDFIGEGDTRREALFNCVEEIYASSPETLRVVLSSGIQKLFEEKTLAVA